MKNISLDDSEYFPKVVYFALMFIYPHYLLLYVTNMDNLTHLDNSICD